jgi:cytochrome c oxidase subunit III
MADRSAAHFENMSRQAHAARLGMWVFLASEVLFFGGLFALYATYRTEHPRGFGVAVEHNTLALGTLNTGVLLVSSYTIALAVHALRAGKTRAAALFVAATMFLGVSFLAIKAGEYMTHFAHGIYPGGVGEFYRDHPDAGTKTFFTLYFCMTGLHAIHVVAGLGVLAVVFGKVLRGKVGTAAPYPLALAATYWHLVDVIWIFLWPLFYLLPGPR